MLLYLVIISLGWGVMNINKKPSRHLSDGFVGLPGFEPGMTGPESVVLPLHHSPIWIVVIFDTAKVEYYFYSAKKIATFFRFLCDFLSATLLKSLFLQLYFSTNQSLISLFFAYEYHCIGRHTLFAAFESQTLGSRCFD